MANHELDVALSASTGRFVRFADDVVALCSRYEDAQALERCFIAHCDKSGLRINFQKSPGVAIISDRSQELRTYRHFDYLGYRFKERSLSIPEKVSNRIKNRISRLVHIYLLQYLEYGYKAGRASAGPLRYDWDLLGLIYEVRKSLYGGLTEAELAQFVQYGKRLPKMRGLMGFYCLIDDPVDLRALDGWLLSVVRRAMVARNLLLAKKYGCACPKPSNSGLANGTWLDVSAWRGNELPETRMPSFVRGWRAARKHYFTFGLEQVQSPGYSLYSEIGDFPVY